MDNLALAIREVVGLLCHDSKVEEVIFIKSGSRFGNKTNTILVLFNNSDELIKFNIYDEDPMLESSSPQEYARVVVNHILIDMERAMFAKKFLNE